MPSGDHLGWLPIEGALLTQQVSTPDQAAIDAAIALLEGIRSRLGPPAA